MQVQVRLRAAAALLGGVLALGAAPAAPSQVFGPETYVRTTGQQDVYTDTFAFGAAATLPLWVHNGDDEGNRVSSGSVVVNGQTVVSASDFNQQAALFSRPAPLVQGTNTITVTLGGEPGSFVTLWIPAPNQYARATLGRVLLPFATASGLVLDLKNGSHEHPRAVRVVFYDPAGQAVAASDRFRIPPRGSLSVPAVQLVAHGAFTHGSLEVFYAGAGYGRLFGQAVETDAHTGVSSIVALQQAGHRRIEPRPVTTRLVEPSSH